MSGLERKKVLVVEDEALLAMSLQDMLTDMGAHTVGPALSIEKALRLAEEGEFDVALLDLNLSGRSSYQVADIVRERAVPYVFVTGYGKVDTGHHAAAPMIQKPFQPEQIKAALSNALAAGRGNGTAAA